MTTDIGAVVSSLLTNLLHKKMITVEIHEPNIDIRKVVSGSLVYSSTHLSSSPTEIQTRTNSGDFRVTLHGTFSKTGSVVTSYDMYRSNGTALYSVYGLQAKYMTDLSAASGSAGFLMTDIPNLQGSIWGTSGGFRIIGSEGNDNCLPWSFSNLIFDAGSGVDTLKISGGRSQFSVERDGDAITMRSDGGMELTYTTTGVERFEFIDTAVAFDITGNGGQAYRLYQAALNRTPDKSGLGFQMKALDNGATLNQVAQNFLNSLEFQTVYGTNLGDSQFVANLYKNVLHRLPDTAGLDYQLGALASGAGRAQLLVNFSESPENQAALVGVMQNGIAYAA